VVGTAGRAADRRQNLLREMRTSENVGAEAARDFFAVGLRIFGGAVGGHPAGDGLRDSFSVSGEIINRPSAIQAIAEVFVGLGEQRMRVGAIGRIKFR
jgi:hypothetical protein